MFQPYGICEDIPDPIARVLSGLLDEVTGLRARLAELEQERAAERPVIDPGRASRRRSELVATSGGNGSDDGD